MGLATAAARFFAPDPPVASSATSPDEVKAKYRFWQRRVLTTSIVGYAMYYFVRKNLGIAIPAMERDLHISKSQLGLFLTLHGVLYGISKFSNGFLGDRLNARVFMVVGLACSAVLNLCFGFSSTVWCFGIFWMLNGWVQGMGFPPCARVLTHWFTPKQLVTKMSLWNISHTIGGSGIVILCGYLVLGSWRLCFIVPAGLAFICCVYLWLAMPDTPPGVGLPELEATKSASDHAGHGPGDFRAAVMKHVFRNPYVWLISFANFFVYVIRYAFLDWGPTLLNEAKHIPIQQAGWMVAGFELCGLAGTLVGGWATDRFFAGRCLRACVVYMACATVAILLFWQFAGESRFWNPVLLGGIGFFIYGPQSLIGVAAANLATKRAAATSVGLTGLFGYASTVLSGWGLGSLIQHSGWKAGFIGLVASAVVGMLLFAIGWNAKAHGYDPVAGAAEN